MGNGVLWVSRTAHVQICLNPFVAFLWECRSENGRELGKKISRDHWIGQSNVSEPGVQKRQQVGFVLWLWREGEPLLLPALQPGRCRRCWALGACCPGLPASTEGASTHTRTGWDLALAWEQDRVVQPTCLAPCASLLPSCGWGPSFRWGERGGGEASGNQDIRQEGLAETESIFIQLK